MQFRQFSLTVTAVAAMLAMSAHAQTSDQLKEALSQAQAAAAQAQAAAKQAQETLLLVQAAMAKQAADKTAAPATQPAIGGGTGLTITNGVNSATLYGLIDVSYVNQTNANAAGKSVTGPRVAWFSGNRVGLTGQRLLGGTDDLKAIFKLESEFESQTGNQDTAGVLFNRDAWVGLDSKSIGKLTFGRQNALARDPAATGIYGDPYGGTKATVEEGGGTNTNNFKQLIFYAGGATGTRYNNGIVWKKEFGPIVAGIGYQFGAIPGSFNRGSTKSASLAYNGDSYTVAGFLTSANINDLTHTSYSFGGNVALGPIVRLHGGYYNYTAKQGVAVGDRKDTAYTISANIKPNATYDFQLGYQSMRANNAGLNGAGYVQNAFSDASAVTKSSTGNRNTLYVSAFYHLDRATEFYVVADRLSTTGNYLAAQANGFRGQTEFGAGFRFKF